MSFAVVDDVPVSRFHYKLAAACSGGPLLDGHLLPSRDGAVDQC
jgi:MFS transporter, putative metabolite transport protein